MSSLSVRDRILLLSGQHPRPHDVLGPHRLGADTLRIRVYQPNALNAVLILDPSRPDASIELTQIAPGIFETVVLSTEPFSAQYHVRFTLADGHSLTREDPYAHAPPLTAFDLHLAAEGRHMKLHEKLGAHLAVVNDTHGVSFAVWAPNARAVSVVGDFNAWDEQSHPLSMLGTTGVWALFVPGLQAGHRYKFSILTAMGDRVQKLDPYARHTELRPNTAGVIVAPSSHHWRDSLWMSDRATRDPLRSPMSIYEVHLGSWMRDDEGAFLPYEQIVERLATYVRANGFTHVELLPLTEHPFDGSWGYQVTGYFSPSARFGTPDGLRALVDTLHAHGIGVIMDWVPAHFPRDAHALGRFDGTPLFEHFDPRRGEQPDWGTFVFDYGRNEVRNFLIASALFWLDEFHIDGLRVDAVASMLYLDYSRKPGEWAPNRYGGRENLEAIAFLRELNEAVHEHSPGAVVMAEESTAWPAVTRPAHLGGLGFHFKWNMGWMHDTLKYFALDPLFRRFHHNQITFSIMYAWSEQFLLPLSHDEVVHLKGSLLEKMPGDRWQRFANLRALYGYMWCHPGKKLLFMGGEMAVPTEWNHDVSLGWSLLKDPLHQGMAALVRTLNTVYAATPALWETDPDPNAFQWSVVHDSDQSVLAFLRYDRTRSHAVLCVLNATPRVRERYRLGVPVAGEWLETVNTDAAVFGGSNVGNMGRVTAVASQSHGFVAAMEITLPPLAVLWFTSPEIPVVEQLAQGEQTPPSGMPT